MALSAMQSEAYTLTTGELGTGELGRVPHEDTETALGTKCLEKDHIERCVTKMGMMVVGGFGWTTVAGGVGHWVDHWRGLI